MSFNSTNILINISKNRFAIINNAIRCYSRKTNNSESPYKHVKPRRNLQLQEEGKNIKIILHLIVYELYLNHWNINMFILCIRFIKLKLNTKYKK